MTKLVSEEELRAQGKVPGRTKLYMMIRDGQYPKPLKIGRKNLFVEAEAEAWFQSQLEAR